MCTGLAEDGMARSGRGKGFLGFLETLGWHLFKVGQSSGCGLPIPREHGWEEECAGRHTGRCQESQGPGPP